MTDNKEMFPVTHVCREDIIHAFKESDIFEQVKKKVKMMDNSDMEYLAGKLADDYCEQLFWDSLKIIFEEELEIDDFFDDDNKFVDEQDSAESEDDEFTARDAFLLGGAMGWAYEEGLEKAERRKVEKEMNDKTDKREND